MAFSLLYRSLFLQPITHPLAFPNIYKFKIYAESRDFFVLLVEFLLRIIIFRQVTTLKFHRNLHRFWWVFSGFRRTFQKMLRSLRFFRISEKFWEFSWTLTEFWANSDVQRSEWFGRSATGSFNPEAPCDWPIFASNYIADESYHTEWKENWEPNILKTSNFENLLLTIPTAIDCAAKCKENP